MKNITYFLLLILVVGSCKFADKPYSFEREYDGGTYITPEGIVKYLSGSPDSAITISDNYAIIQERINYHKEGGTINGVTIHQDSILVYGHVFSKTPNPSVLKDEVTKLESLSDLNDNVAIYYTGTDEPSAFISVTELGAGTTFKNTLALSYETEYFIRSFVITGRFNGSEVEYNDIAYNQYELVITTQTPNDLWVGEGMEFAPDNFDNNTYWGGTSFTYNGKIYVAQGHDESDFGTNLIIWEFDPEREANNQWVIKYTQDLLGKPNFTNAISFVIEDVELVYNTQAYYDCAYIGTGLTFGGSTSKLFYRINLESPSGDITLVADDNESIYIQDFPVRIHNAVAFVIDGIAYVGTGSTSLGDPLTKFYKYDPSAFGTYNKYGTWSEAGNFGGGTRKQAAVFQIGDEVYLCGGEASGGTLKNDLWRATQTNQKNLTWVRRADFPAEMVARSEHVAFAVGENGYVGTGWDGSVVALKDFWRYDPRLNSWERRTDYGGIGRFEAIGAGLKISDNDYRGYIGTGWAGTPSNDFNGFWHYRP